LHFFFALIEQIHVLLKQTPAPREVAADPFST
jgi:hypothetical protein